jgi:hypothetical protein
MKRPFARHLLALAPVCLAVGVGFVGGSGGVTKRPTVDGPSPGYESRLTSPARSTRTPATASWCGTATQMDRAPNVVAGNPAHWVYAFPSDGQDRLASVANTMQSDAETIDTWWRGQDGTRTPRFDLAQLSCGTQLDVTDLRLSQSSSQLSPVQSRFQTIANALFASGLDSHFEKYVVYYDGPAPSDVCGQGGSLSNGLGYAVVYVQACSGVPTGVVAVHELVHAYGAVPTGAPNACSDSPAHVCDTDRDLMYPFADGTPLSGLFLDSGRNDYYGHSGAWPDVQDSPWLVQLDRQVPFTVTVTGSGSVVSDVPGLECTVTCTTTWNADTVLGLQATPAPGMKLVRWGGACSGGMACRVSVAPGVAASVLFAPATFRLSVRVGGKGTVRSSSGGIACPKRCSATVASFASVRLTAKPAKGWRFKGWQGSCRGKRAVCAVPMSADTGARAVFART